MFPVLLFKFGRHLYAKGLCHCLAQIYPRLIILPQVFSPPRKEN